MKGYHNEGCEMNISSAADKHELLADQVSQEDISAGSL
jgi:hypothetical protein